MRRNSQFAPTRWLGWRRTIRSYSVKRRSLHTLAVYDLSVYETNEGVLMSGTIRAVVLTALASGMAVPLASAGDLGIGVTISGEITPGVYGQVVLGNQPPPPLVL